MNKYEYVRKAGDAGGHHCHWPGCGEVCNPAFWGCRRHWFMLPLSIRRMIWASYRPGHEVSKRPSAAYLSAVTMALDWIRANHPNAEYSA